MFPGHDPHSCICMAISASVPPVYDRLLLWLLAGCLHHAEAQSLCAGPEVGNEAVTSGAEQMQPRRIGVSLEYDDGDSVWDPQLTGNSWSSFTCQDSVFGQLHTEHTFHGGWASAAGLMHETLFSPVS